MERGAKQMSIEKLKQVQEALKELVPDPQCDFGPAYEGAKQRQKQAITSLRTLIEQMEKQEPVAYQLRHPNVNFGNWYTVDMDRHRRATKDFERRELVVSGAAPPAAPVQGAEGWTERELELIDGMIQVQLDHAQRCDSIANRTMAEKQKGWDMERVALLQKIKATPPAAPVQEPLGYVCVHANGKISAWLGPCDQEFRANRDALGDKLYPFFNTTPPAAPVQEPNEADELLVNLGLDPQTYRTDGGAINYLKVKAAMRHPAEYPVKREHITDGNPCWCNPETDYVDPETGIAVIVHKEPQ
jgi:hypothetical protein